MKARRRFAAGIVVASAFWIDIAAAGEREPIIAGQVLRKFEPLIGTWEARGEGFTSRLTYRWRVEGSVLESENELRDEKGGLLRHYLGTYAWDSGVQEVTLWVSGPDGEVHRGRSWWQDGVLWHQAEISGKRPGGYFTGVVPANGDQLDFFANFGSSEPDPDLLTSVDPLVYKRRTPVEPVGSRFIVLLRLRHDLRSEEATNERPDDGDAAFALEAHQEYWRGLFEQGKVVLSGTMDGNYWDNAAQIVLNVETAEEAEALLRGDPAVRSDLFEAQIRPFTVRSAWPPWAR